MKYLVICLLFLSACTTVDLNKSINIKLDQAGVGETGSTGEEGVVCRAPIPYVVVPITINYYTASEQNLSDMLKSDTTLKGPGL